ncbi:MAG: NAD-binding protein, partial [Candidatus Thermoplasmatota archaeon]|nr:NAD-binding protein [Candidatus Thermoplasmatota archaeon]
MLKGLPIQLRSLMGSRRGRRNLGALGKFVLVFVAMVTVYAIAFHGLMALEGREFSWVTSVYWTLTVMSTLGFGDITFATDLGRVFSMVVLLSGMTFLLVLLPFTFVEFFYEPWMKAQEEARAPRRLPEGTRDHVLLTHLGPVTSTLIRRLTQYNRPYYLVVADVEEALRLHDMGINVLLGDLDDPETWRRACVDTAALVATTSTDVRNTNVAFTVRGLAPDLPIVASAKDAASVDILELAGSTRVLRLDEIIGQSFARRTLGGDARAHVIGAFDDLLVAEAIARGTPLVGRTLQDARLRQRVGVTVVGVLERGRFQPARAETEITEETILLLAGSEEHMDQYDAEMGTERGPVEPVVILGGGRVGRATARALAERGLDHRIVEPLEERILDPKKYV